MSSELYYFPNIEKDSNPSTLSLELHSGFEKNLKNSGYGNETLIKNRNLKTNGISQSEFAYSEGLKEGERVGREKEKNRVEEAVELLRNTLENLKKIQYRIHRQNERDYIKTLDHHCQKNNRQRSEYRE